MRALTVLAVLLAVTAPSAAGQQAVAPAAASAPSLGTSPLLPGVDGPERLLRAQELVLVAYPELRTVPVQVRVTETPTGAIVTFGAAERDREGVLALSRPRAALLVCELTFDGGNVIRRALMRGSLARTAERQRIGSLPTGWGKALEDDGAAFGPSKRAAFLQQLDLAPLWRVLGTVAVDAAHFQVRSVSGQLAWLVTGLSSTGETVQLDFEPYSGRLVRLERTGVTR